MRRPSETNDTGYTYPPATRDGQTSILPQGCRRDALEMQTTRAEGQASQ